VERALVVHGAGLDEIALHGETEAIRLSAGAFERLTIAPEDVGFERAPLATIQGGGPEENGQRLKALLLGYGTGAERRAVALNAGALLMTAGLAADLKEGADLALQAIGSGRALARLDALVEISNA
jgi:anthranilate phosphoribosyltransferase